MRASIEEGIHSSFSHCFWYCARTSSAVNVDAELVDESAGDDNAIHVDQASGGEEEEEEEADATHVDQDEGNVSQHYIPPDTVPDKEEPLVGLSDAAFVLCI